MRARRIDIMKKRSGRRALLSRFGMNMYTPPKEIEQLFDLFLLIHVFEGSVRVVSLSSTRRPDVFYARSLDGSVGDGQGFP